jgi:hypothetical protein
MKTPNKPFTVEVRRSRSNTLVSKPLGSEPAIFIEGNPEAAALSVSEALQLAERTFPTLTVSASVEREARVSAQSVFGPLAPNAATVEQAASEAPPSELGTQASPVKE